MSGDTAAGWLHDDTILSCPRCHHGQKAHYSATTGRPIKCVGAKGKYWDPATGRLVGPTNLREGDCDCTYATGGAAAATTGDTAA